MDALTKKNRKELIGIDSFWEDGKSLSAIVDYESGIEHFDTILGTKSVKDLNAKTHIKVRKTGLEIVLARLFKLDSVGIPFAEIENIFLTKANNPQIIIELEKDTILLNFNSSNMPEISDFFYEYCYSKVKIKKTEQNDFRSKYPCLQNYKRKVPTHKLESLQASAFMVGIISLLTYIFINPFKTNINDLFKDTIILYSIILLIRIASTILCNKIAKISKRSQVWWSIFGFVSPVLSLTIIAFIKPKDKKIAEKLSELGNGRKIGFFFEDNKQI
jgi:hypothetical protein